MNTTSGAPVQTTAQTTAQSPGMDRIWSEEHGHWHNAPAAGKPVATPTGQSVRPLVSVLPDGTAVRNQDARARSSSFPQPPGPVPAGKVWSPEHGHWHDATASQVTAKPATPISTPQPPGPAPEGKVWSAEHGHWHEVPSGSTPPETPRR
ncbi:MAG TPA: hypothetical protein VM534_07125 [Thermoanaerobaculia bacterium]|nr:hypothetical protein [Thermoanaerobaculia bacterium]